MELFGVHGTTRSRADNIIASKFEARPGRVGTGIYFWHQNSYSLILAKGWYLFSKKKGQYNSDRDQNYACFEVTINVDSENFLDLEEPKFKDKLALIAYKRNIGRGANDDEITALYDLFINELESELDTEFYVWQSRVNAPYTCAYPYEILGNPLSYVVYKNECIVISKYIHEDGDNETKIFRSNR